MLLFDPGRLYPKTRGKLLTEFFARMNRFGAVKEKGFSLNDVGIRHTAVHGANRRALLFIEMPNALSAFVGIDDVDVFAFGDRLIGTLRLTRTAIDALFGNDGCHKKVPFQSKNNA